jgi:histidinol-phosphate/aromatic aminotransferase/cobyric acid decarboxylase-like protein
LGYLLSNADNMEVISKTRFAHESNALSNAVASYLLDHYELVEEYNSSVVESRDALKDELDRLGIPSFGSNGNFLLLDLGDRDRAAAFVKHLRGELIYVKGPWCEPWDKFVTITIGPRGVMEPFMVETKLFLEGEA